MNAKERRGWKSLPVPMGWHLLLSWAVWGMLAAHVLLLPCPAEAARSAGVVYLAHLANPRPTPPAGEVTSPTPAKSDPAPAAGRQDKPASSFLPHGTCLSWRPGLLWLHAVSDSLTALSYFSIPVALIVLVRRRKDLQFGWMFLLFGLFILACGTGHVMSLYNLWVPDYQTSGVVKAITAVVSVITAVILWPLIPKAVALPGPAQWEAVNRDLRNEVAERAEAEAEVRRLNAELEERVAARTAELEAANNRLAEANLGLRKSEGQLRESQCLLRAIIDNSTAVIYVKDLEGRYLMVNRRFEELFHVRQEAVAGKTDHDLFPGELADAFRAFDQRVLAAGAALEAEEVAPLDDGPHTYLSIKAPLSDEAGRPYAVCGISADITGRKRDEQEIRRLNAELERKMAELVAAQEELVRKEKLATLGQLSGSVGHELRNPLGVMNNAIYFLKTVLGDADESVREYLGIIKKEIDNSQRIITDLLDFARTKTPQTKAVTARELVSESLGRCAIPDNVALRTEIPDALPLLRVDPLQMVQVLQNFVANAVQAMPDGGSLRIGARKVSSSGFRVSSSGLQPETLNSKLETGFVEISVTDTGVGISPEGMQRLFQPLFTTKAKGIGLGLTVCRNLTEANGGRIEVESALGKGTTFALTLPAERGVSDEP